MGHTLMGVGVYGVKKKEEDNLEQGPKQLSNAETSSLDSRIA